MPRTAQPALTPRKTPVQKRSTETVDAILEAALQVLIAVGKEQLTTTRVAQRAGVSVGTLYQYFPNKRALLQAALRRHIAEVAGAIESVCAEYRNRGVLEMGTALVDAYLDAKMRNVKVSVTLYAVSSDIEGMAIAKAATARSLRRVTELLTTARERLRKEPDVIASMVLAAMNGTAHRLLDASSPERLLAPLRAELLTLVHAYLRTCID